MKLIVATSLVAAALVTIACGERAPDPEPVRPRTGATTESRGAPAWIDNWDSVPGKLGASGSAQPNALNDRSMQRDMALSDARAKLAKSLSTRVSTSGVTASTAAMSASQQGQDKTSSSSASMVRTTLTRERAEALLTGAQPWQWWTDPKDGVLWVFLVVDKEAN